MDERIAQEPTPADVTEFADLLENILSKLTKEQCQALIGKLEGLNQNEIADRLNVNVRTVQRMGPALRRAAIATLGFDVPHWIYGQAEYQAMWKSVLSEKVSAWLPASSHSHELDSLELLPFLNSEHATLEALNALRSGAKHRGVNAKNAEDDYPAKIVAAVYLLSIAVAALRHQKRISRESDLNLLHRTQFLLDEGWLDTESTQILKAFSSVLCT